MQHGAYQTLADICSAQESVNVFLGLRDEGSMVNNEPPHQIIELIGIQGWRLVWRSVRLDVRTRVHLHSCPQTKDDGGMREFHFISVKAEKKRIPGAEFGVLGSDERQD